MKIGILLHPYGEEKPGGLARTIFEWTKSMLSQDSKNEYIIFLKNKPQRTPELPGKNWQMCALGGGIFWMEKLKNAPQADVYLFQTPVLPLFYRPRKTCVIVQDFPYKYLRPKNIKEFFRNRFVGMYHGFSLRKADQLVAVSNSTKNDCMRFFGIPEHKIKVIHMGFKRICETPQSVFPVPERFFLFVGVVKERKNVFTIVKGFEEFKRKNPKAPQKLAIGGKAEGPYYQAIVEYIRTKKLEKDVIFLGYLNDSQLSFVYRKTDALVFPSSIEGFGMPVLEAMDCGTAVITSNIFGPSEVGEGGAALLVDPKNSSEIAGAFEKIAFDPDIRKKLVENGLKRSREFSWDIAGRELLKLIITLSK